MRVINSLSDMVPTETAEIAQGNNESAMDTAEVAENLATMETCSLLQSTFTVLFNNYVATFV